MADETRIVPNRREVAGFLKAAGVRDLIARKVQDIESAAKSAAGAGHGQFRTDISDEGKRVRGAVIGDYATADPEDSRRALLRGIDGGTG